MGIFGTRYGQENLNGSMLLLRDTSEEEGTEDDRKVGAAFEKAAKSNNLLGPKKWIGGGGHFNRLGVIPTTGRYAQTVESTQKRTGKQLKVK